MGGFVIVLERPFLVDDKRAIGHDYHEVIDIGLRSTRLPTPTETLAVVPNFTIFNNVVRNTNTRERGIWSCQSLIEANADIERVARIIGRR